MENTVSPSAGDKKDERHGMAISGLILGIVALLCAFLNQWRVFAIIIALISITVSVISLRYAVKKEASKARSIAGIICSVLAIGLAGYYIAMDNREKKTEETHEIPAELRDTVTNDIPDEGTLDMLKNSMDSSATH